MKPALYAIVHVGPARLALLALVVVLAGEMLATIVHGQGETDGWNRAEETLADQHIQELATLQAAFDRMMADAYLDNAVLRDRLSDLQARYSALWERAEQSTAERDYARSRLGAYEPRFRDHAIDAYAVPRPGTSTPQLREGTR